MLGFGGIVSHWNSIRRRRRVRVSHFCISLFGLIDIEENLETDRCWLEDNVYTVRDSEVVSTGCYHASMVSDSTDWTMGSFSAVASGISV